MAHDADVPPFIVPAALDDAGLSVYEFRALAHVARRAGADGLYYGSGTRSSATCRMSLRQWRRACADLVRMGFLEVMQQAAGTRTVYRCTTVTGASQASVPVTDVHGTGAPQAGGPVHHRPIYEKESPSRSPLKEKQTAPAAPGAGSRVQAALATIERTAAPSWSREACDDWIARFQGTAPGGEIGRALRSLVETHTWAVVRVAWRSYLAQAEAEYVSAARFAKTYGRWSGAISPRVQPRAESIGDRAMSEAAKFVANARSGGKS